MEIKGLILWQLGQVRQLSEGVLADFKTPEDWTYQVHPKANHAMWFAGHIGNVDNFLIAKFAPQRAVEKPQYAEKFGMGSAPVADPKQYPPPEEVHAFMRERRQTLLEVLGGLSESDLAQPVTGRAPPFVKTTAELLMFVSMHEGLHAGQITVARRALGKKPLFGTVQD